MRSLLQGACDVSVYKVLMRRAYFYRGKLLFIYTERDFRPHEKANLSVCILQSPVVIIKPPVEFVKSPLVIIEPPVVIKGYGRSRGRIPSSPPGYGQGGGDVRVRAPWCET